MELADLIVSSAEQDNPQQGPDPSLDPSGALDHHRNLWPLNSKVESGSLEDTDGSDRIRLRRVGESLTDAGFSVSGAERSSFVRGAQIGFSTYFDRSGSAGRIGVSIEQSIAEDALGVVQQALQSQGFGAVVTVDGEIVVLDQSEAEMVRYVEAGGATSSYGRVQKRELEPEEVLSWRNSIPGISPNEISAWMDRGCDVDQAIAWQEAGITHSYEADYWMKAGRTPDQAKDWRDAGVSVHAAAEWIRAGRTPAQAEKWVQVGLSSYGSVSAWENIGLDASKAAHYLRMRGCSEPSHVQLLLDNSVAIKDVEEMVKSSITVSDIIKIREWIGRYKIELPEAIEWAKLGPEFIGPGKRGRWHKAGFTPGMIKVWQAALGKRAITLDEVRALSATGYDPEAAKDWVSVHPDLARSELSSKWLEAGLSPKQASEWVSVSDHFVNYTLVSGWIEDGLGPEEARPWADAADKFQSPRLCSRPVVKDWLAADPRCSDPETVAQLMAFTEPQTLPRIVELLEK